MAIKIYEQFKPFANPADGDHPYGSFKNDSIPGAEDGTPLDSVWANDYAGFDAALLAEAGIVPSGAPDKLGSSQRLEAIKAVCANVTKALYPIVRAVEFLPVGYVTDGSIDYRAQIQLALNAAVNKLLLLPDFPVLIDPAGSTYGGLDVPSNSKIFNPYNGELRIKPNDLSNYEILSIRDKVNIEIYSPKCVGDKYTHTGVTGEYGMGLAIRGACENIKIYNPVMNECWGDGYYIGQTSDTVESTPKDIHIYNPTSNRCRRQGMSVISADGLYLYGRTSFNDTKSSDSPVPLLNGPHAGIDIEPNSENSKISKIFIENLTGEGNDAGLFYIFLGAIATAAGQRYPVDVNVVNISDDGSASAAHFVGLNKDARYSGAINIGTINSNNSVIGGILKRNWPVQCGLPVNIGVATVTNWRSLTTNPAYLRAAVSLYQSNDATYPAIGNLFIERLHLRSTLSQAGISSSVIFAQNTSNAGLKNVEITLGTVYTNIITASVIAECPAGVIKFNSLGDFGSKLRQIITSSSQIYETLIADIDVIPSGGSPTLSLPVTLLDIYKGSRRRLRYTQGGTATFVRLRSPALPMYVNGVVATNALFDAASGVVDIEFGNGIFYVSCKGAYTKES